MRDGGGKKGGAGSRAIPVPGISVRDRSALRDTPSAYLGEPVPATLSQELMIERVVDGCRLTLAETLDRHRTPEGLSGAVSACLDLFDRSLDAMTFTPALACGPGCIHCCYNPISLTPPEALHLGAYLLRTADAGFLARVSERTREICDRIRGLDRTEMGLVRHELLCPLIYEGRCMVHPARPLVCRGWNSVDAKTCRQSVVEADPMVMIENHPMPRLLADAVQLGLLRGSREAGLEAGYLTLPHALRLLLEHGVAGLVRDWLGGGPFFARHRG